MIGEDEFARMLREMPHPLVFLVVFGGLLLGSTFIVEKVIDVVRAYRVARRVVN